MATLLYGNSVQKGWVWLLRLCIILLLASVMVRCSFDKGGVKVSTLLPKNQMEMKQNLVGKVQQDQSGGWKDCEDNDGEECLDRRFLEAHTDYIYTQHHNGP
ncbi:hypothetical protein SUGI_0901740 [Cryptomeria japonica]|uniref:phytosulfokines 5 n=1 Tax=Cryptomeria japonica TaxID=3369 RepID=UPI002414971C|nr:phytosulfokines 5 [Cryptomeria japonica]GLJ43398.1 hypothetical protein SUGI_0901740 [Cryptomeria japonica]